MKLGEKIRYLREVEGTLRGLGRALTQQEVVDVIRRLEGELHRSQNGGTSEVLQLLIGRDDHVRYQIPKREDLIRIQGAHKA